MFNRLIAFFNVLKSGQSLRDPAIWKNRQLLANAILGVLGAVLVFFPDITIDDVDMEIIAGGIATLACAVNAYLTMATSKKVGVGKKCEISD